MLEYASKSIGYRRFADLNSEFGLFDDYYNIDLENDENGLAKLKSEKEKIIQLSMKESRD